MAVSASAEIARPAPSPEASTTRPAPKESISKRAAEGLKKTVGTAREKLREWVKSPAQKAAEEARQRVASIPDEAKKAGDSETVFRQQKEMKVQSDGARANSDSREAAQNLANFAKTEPETRRHLERQGLSAEQVNARIASMRWEAEHPQQAQKAKTDAKDQSPSVAQKKGAETKSTPTAEKTQTKAETEDSVQTRIAELTAQNAAKDAKIAKLTEDLANRPTLEDVDARIKKAVADALAAERAKPAAETPQPKPETASQTPAKAAVAAEVDKANKAQEEAKPENAEVAALRSELAQTQEALTKLSKQMEEAQQAARASLLKQAETTPGLKEKVLGTQNWLALLIAGGGVIGMGAAEDNKKKAMAQAA